MSTTHLDENLRDALQEIANVAVGQTADKLARSFAAFVKMPIPRVHLLESVDIRMAIGGRGEGEDVTAVTQAFFGDGVCGEALLLMNDSNAGELSRLMGYPAPVTEQEKLEHVLEISSLLTASCIQSVLEQLEINVLISHPTLLGRHNRVEDLFLEQDLPWDKTLAIELNYLFEGYSLCCDLILLFHQDSLPAMFEKLEFLTA
jgi:chemotaxis protein CheY-P-specific phosphatase CheC